MGRGEDGKEKKSEKATWGALTTILASSPPLPQRERDKTLIRAHTPHSRRDISLLPGLSLLLLLLFTREEEEKSEIMLIQMEDLKLRLRCFLGNIYSTWQRNEAAVN